MNVFLQQERSSVCVCSAVRCEWASLGHDIIVCGFFRFCIDCMCLAEVSVAVIKINFSRYCELLEITMGVIKIDL